MTVSNYPDVDEAGGGNHQAQGLQGQDCYSTCLGLNIHQHRCWEHPCKDPGDACDLHSGCGGYDGGVEEGQGQGDGLVQDHQGG